MKLPSYLTMQPLQRITIWRRVIQLASLLVTGEWLAVGWLRCPFAVPFVSCTSCPLTDCPGRYLQIPVLIGLLASGLVSGRLFCGWACPMGLVEDLLSRLPRAKAFSTRYFATADRYLKYLKYPLLLVVVYLVFAVHEVAGRPYPYVVRSPSVWNVEALETVVALGASRYAVRLWILASVLALSLLVTRFWCRYLCPLGAVLGLLNHISLFKLGIVPERCRACGDCLRVCPMATTPSSVDCTWCTDCLSACKDQALVVANRLQRLARRPGESIEEPAATPVRPQDEEVELL